MAAGPPTAADVPANWASGPSGGGTGFPTTPHGTHRIDTRKQPANAKAFDDLMSPLLPPGAQQA